MQETLLEKIVKVSSVTNLNPEDKKPINFKDENGDKYILWKTNKQGISVAYENFSKLPYGGDGATIGIAYIEEPKTFTNDQGKEIAFTQRTVRVVKDPSQVKPQNQVPNYPKVETPRPSVNSSPRPPQSLTRDFDAENRGKVRYGFALEAFKANKVLDVKLVGEIKKWVDYTMSGELFNFTKEPMNVPVNDYQIQEIEDDSSDIKVENIPFG